MPKVRKYRYGSSQSLEFQVGFVVANIGQVLNITRYTMSDTFGAGIQCYILASLKQTSCDKLKTVFPVIISFINDGADYISSLNFFLYPTLIPLSGIGTTCFFNHVVNRFPQSSPRRSVLCCPHPATSRDLHQIVGSPCGGPTNAASLGTLSPFEDLSAPTAVSPPRNVPCPLPLEVCNSSGYVGDLSSFTDLVISDSIT
jgi:hypothetical protein